MKRLKTQHKLNHMVLSTKLN